MAAGQQNSVDQAPPEPAQTTVTVTVTDRDHRPITGLKAEDFTLYEDGQRQPISSVTFGDVPACIGLLVDGSGSMRGKHAAIASAMEEFVRSGNPGSQVFVVMFSDNSFLEQDFTRDAAFVERALARADARGGTAMYDAIIASVDHLAESKACNKRVLVIVSDGEDNESRKSLEYTLKALRNAGNPLIYAIGLPHPNVPSTHSRHVLEALTAPSGGAAFFIGNLGDIRKSVLKMAEEIRDQYSVTYAAHAKSAYPEIKLEAHAPGRKGLVVRVNVARKPDLPAVVSAAQSHGSGCISGSVLDEEKKPVAGINVEAWPVFSPNSYPKDSFPSITTDASGNFRISELEPGQYLLYTKNESAGYPPTKNPFYRDENLLIQTSEKCTNFVVRVGAKAAKLKISAVDLSTGTPLAHFGVSLRNRSGALLVISKATQEQEILVPARTELTVSAWSYRYPRSQPVAITTPGPEASQQVTVQLEQRVQSSSGREQER
jgi:Ca-activated chloride channel homolog